MENARSVILFMFLCLFTPAYSQTVLADFDLESARVDGIQAFPVHDSVFLSFVDRRERKTYWINKAGNKSKVDMMINPEFPIVGIQPQPRSYTLLLLFKCHQWTDGSTSARGASG
jgi:hypothetical protein